MDGRSSSSSEEEGEIPKTMREELDRYALFNANDWDGVRALVSDDCRLDLVSNSHRRGKPVGLYFTNYEKVDVALRVVRLEDSSRSRRMSRAQEPAYFMLIEFEGGRVQSIRDFRYVAYIPAEADFEMP